MLYEKFIHDYTRPVNRPTIPNRFLTVVRFPIQTMSFAVRN